jgi:precorrin-6B methylase 2
MTNTHTAPDLTVEPLDFSSTTVAFAAVTPAARRFLADVVGCGAGAVSVTVQKSRAVAFAAAAEAAGLAVA